MSILRGSALEMLGHCHHMCGIHKVMQLLLDSKTQRMSKASLMLVMTNATTRTTVTPYNLPLQTRNPAERARQQISNLHKVVPQTASTNARSVSLSSKSATFSSKSFRLTAETNSH
jgi:hypothetical protein